MKVKLPSTTNFETKHADNGSVTIIGLDKDSLNAFVKNCAVAAFDGKHYKLTMIEADSSPAQKNFCFVVYKHIIEYLKMDYKDANVARIRVTFEDTFLNLCKSIDNDLYDYDYWIVPIIDLKTGEIKSERLLPMSNWSTGHMSEYIDFLESTTTATWSDFKFPNPKDYKGEPKGEKSTIKDPTKFYQLP